MERITASDIREDINKVIRDKQFVEVGIEEIKRILEENENIDVDSIKNLLENIKERYGEEGVRVLPKVKIGIDCEGLSRDEYIDKMIRIVECYSYIPIMVELKNIIVEQRREIRELSENKEDETDFDVDWEAEYHKVKETNEENVRKIEEINEELKRVKKDLEKTREILKKERKFYGEENEEIREIIEDQDLELLKSKIEEDPFIIYATDFYGDNLLCLCAKRDWLDGVDLIWEASDYDPIYINKGCSNGKTALMYASMFGYYIIVNYLYVEGTNIEAVDYERKTALMYAAEGGKLMVVQYLIERGANVNAVDIHGCSALDYACRRKNNDEVVQYIKKEFHSKNV